MIGATLLAWLTKKPKYTIFAIILSNIDKALILKKYTDSSIKVLLEYYKYLIVFLRKEADKLVKHQLYNHKIVIEEGKHPKFGPLYRMS